MRRVIALSRAALEHNLRLLADRVPERTRLDLRADAYGHDARFVADVARGLGFADFALDPEAGRTGPDAALLYGVAPEAEPVMSVIGEVVAVKPITAGSPVSYGYSYRVERDGALALIGLGYADGVPRSASSRAHALVGGRRCLVAGRVAMDQLMLELGDATPSPGDEVVLWGGGAAPRLAEWTDASGFAPLALTAGLGARFSRQWRA